MKRLIPATFFACSLIADTTKATSATTESTIIRIPLVGYVARSSPAELRALAGVVGADILDDPTPLPPGITAIMPAPGQQYALAVRGEEGQLGWMAFNVAGLGEFQAIPGALPRADRISFSPLGASAVLYASASQRLQVIGGLPGAARIVRDIDTSVLAAKLTAAAISDDAVLLVGFSTGDSGFVAVMGSDGAAQTVFNASSVAAIRFLPRVHAAVVADSQMNQITVLAGDSFSPRMLAGDAQGVSTPLDLETSSDGRRVYVANSGANNVLMIDLETGNSNALACGFAPAAFARLMKSAVSVTAQEGDAVWVMDTDAAAPWVAFAPRLR